MFVGTMGGSSAAMSLLSPVLRSDDGSNTLPVSSSAEVTPGAGSSARHVVPSGA